MPVEKRITTMTGEQWRQMEARKAHESSLQDHVYIVATQGARPPFELYHTRNSKGSAAGLPDVLAARIAGPHLQLVVAELKKVGKKPTPAQMFWLRVFSWIAQALEGCPTVQMIVRTWTAEDLEEIDALLLGPVPWPAALMSSPILGGVERSR